MQLSIIPAALLASVATASTLKPPVLPLIVRNPYLSTWLQNAREEPWTKWPMFWEGNELGFSVLAHVPDTKEVFPLLGRPQDSLSSHEKDYVAREEGYSISYPSYKGAQYDASTTNLTYSLPAPEAFADASDLNITLSFFSPITPTSTLRQSLPAAYVTVYVEGSFNVSIYIDVNGQWVSGFPDSEIEWTLSRGKANGAVERLKTWTVKRKEQRIFNEEKDQAEWGQLHFTAPDDMLHQSGHSDELRQSFAKTGKLQNVVDGESPRGIHDKEPIFAFSKLFELEKKDGPGRGSVMFTVSHVQDLVTQFASERGLTQMRPLWKSWFYTDEELISFHYHDFANANALATNYSEQLHVDADAYGSDNYVDIVALSARQTMGATSFSGTAHNPILFLKEISSNGNSQTVDVIFPAFPFFLYTNPKWATYLLEPLLEHQLSGQYPNKYSMHDLGAHFPNLTGHADGRDEYMPVEECGDMLIMALSLVHAMTYTSDETAQSIWSTAGEKRDFNAEDDHRFPLTNLNTHNGITYIDDAFGGRAKGLHKAKKWVARSYRLWKQWTGYLVQFARDPENQLSTDDFAGWLPLQTNLALKGIIGIRAFSVLAAILDYDADAVFHREKSEEYLAHWQDRGLSRDKTHAKLSYEWYGSWTTLYSLYSDALLCFHPSTTSNTSTFVPAAREGAQQQPLGRREGEADFIPHTIYTSQSTTYALSLQRYGLPLDSRHLYAKSDWELYAAAVAEPSVRQDILSRVAKWVNETSTDRALSDLYDTEGTGGFPEGIRFHARPVVGGHFAGLSLGRACRGREEGVREGMEL
ncbi:glutaminase A [Bimuria novae-zelandiae CBS 107.79]|uniref:Glutaminase A n=1 Tax=Bimuria novae-zelandiae CBS 107.79 TaxID=1447943 RepID=A0A6A5VS77_9PLEO|nr:glutaminase A [Bimuria novae-zelandiae CBS 107.79]